MTNLNVINQKQTILFTSQEQEYEQKNFKNNLGLKIEIQLQDRKKKNRNNRYHRDLLEQNPQNLIVNNKPGRNSEPNLLESDLLYENILGCQATQRQSYTYNNASELSNDNDNDNDNDNINKNDDNSDNNNDEENNKDDDDNEIYYEGHYSFPENSLCNCCHGNQLKHILEQQSKNNPAATNTNTNTIPIANINTTANTNTITRSQSTNTNNYTKFQNDGHILNRENIYERIYEDQTLKYQDRFSIFLSGANKDKDKDKDNDNDNDNDNEDEGVYEFVETAAYFQHSDDLICTRIVREVREKIDQNINTQPVPQPQ
eukprot:Pgem_evm1s1202